MNPKIQQILSQMKQLEDELADELHQQEQKITFKLEGKRVKFEKTIKHLHQQLKTGVWRWLFGMHPLNIITAPIIYSMIIPLIMVDIIVSLYQACCFPIYKIGKVKRGHYIVFDRHHLSYLNIFERLHCIYCAYANGLLAYSQEILARTEQYFCPIKHAHKVLGTHTRYRNFIAYGDAENYHARLEALRQQLTKEE
jgi:hypothetical protein